VASRLFEGWLQGCRKGGFKVVGVSACSKASNVPDTNFTYKFENRKTWNSIVEGMDLLHDKF
jgi:hypothetical protein